MAVFILILSMYSSASCSDGRGTLLLVQDSTAVLLHRVCWRRCVGLLDKDGYMYNCSSIIVETSHSFSLSNVYMQSPYCMCCCVSLFLCYCCTHCLFFVERQSAIMSLPIEAYALSNYCSDAVLALRLQYKSPNGFADICHRTTQQSATTEVR